MSNITLEHKFTFMPEAWAEIARQPKPAVFGELHESMRSQIINRHRCAHGARAESCGDVRLRSFIRDEQDELLFHVVTQSSSALPGTS